MKAELLLYRRHLLSASELVEIRIWRVPSAVPPRDHEYRYSLVYIREGERILGFDKERGKGDHLHHNGEERLCRFVDVDRPIDDFLEPLEEYL